VLERAIRSARPRPEIPNYDQLSLVISSTVHQALAAGRPVGPAIAALSGQLEAVLRNG
jgi:multiple sugar transport system substrate-binding protein